jgi:hypothetical protein
MNAARSPMDVEQCSKRPAMANRPTRRRDPGRLARANGRRLRAAAVACALVACRALPSISSADAAEITRTDLGIPTLGDTAGFLYKGEIRPGDLLNLQAQISALPADTKVAVVLQSSGGSLYEGVALGRFFHRAKVITVVGAAGWCASACSTAFLGGRDPKTGKHMRIKSSTGRLGFHQFAAKLDPEKKYTKKDRDDWVLAVQEITFHLVEYFKDIEEDLTFLPFMLRAPHEQIRLLSSEDAIAAGIHVFNEQTKQLIDPLLIRQQVKASDPAFSSSASKT